MSYFHAEALVRLGRREEALEVLRRVVETRPTDFFARLAESYRLYLEGDREGSSSLLRELRAERRRAGGSDGEVTFKLASLAARDEHEDEALRDLAEAVDQGFACAPCIEVDPAFDSLRGNSGFRETLRRARERARQLLAEAKAGPPRALP